MNVVAYGGGTNSTAMLIELFHRHEEVDLILFADTGGEQPHTYNFIAIFDKWLIDCGMPSITVVKSPNETLEQSCRKLNVLPALAYGWKTCSQRFKIQPQHVYLNHWSPAKEEWAKGNKLTQLIGYDADEPQRAKEYIDDKYINRYPLIEWDMGRDECIQVIKKAGLPLPGKSACFFCPSMKPHEIKLLNHQYPDLVRRALEMEANAKLTSVKGLGRGWSWRSLLATDDMFESEFTHCIEQACGCYDG